MKPTAGTAPESSPSAFADVISSRVASVLSALYPQPDGAGTPGIDAAAADKWVQTLVTADRQIQSVLAHAVHVAQSADVETRFRDGSAHRYLTRRHDLSHKQARDLLAAAEFTGISRGTDGPITPCEPETAAAATAGRISIEHLATIAEQLDRLPEAWTARRTAVERALTKIATQNSPQATAQEAKDFIKRLTKGKVTDRDRRKRRGLWLGTQHDDGMSYLQGWVTPKARAYFEAMTKVFGQPGLNNIDDEFSPRGTPGGRPASDGAAAEPDRAQDREPEVPGRAEPRGGAEAGTTANAGAGGTARSTRRTADPGSSSPAPAAPSCEPTRPTGAGPEPGLGCGVDPDELAAAAIRDERTLGQRLHDAFAAACEYAAMTGALGTTFRGLPAHLIVTASLEQVESAVGEAVTATGTRMSIGEMLTCAELIHPVLVIFDHNGQPLHFGRTRRLASMEQRMALFARDLGCSRPGCHHGAFGAEAHHLIEWARGGLTDVGSMTLACRADHRHINETTTGLKTWMDPTTGKAAWASRAPDPTRPDGGATPTKPAPGDLLADAVDAEIRESNAGRDKRRKRSRNGPRSLDDRQHPKRKNRGAASDGPVP